MPLNRVRTFSKVKYFEASPRRLDSVCLGWADSMSNPVLAFWLTFRISQKYIEDKADQNLTLDIAYIYEILHCNHFIIPPWVMHVCIMLIMQMSSFAYPEFANTWSLSHIIIGNILGRSWVSHWRYFWLVYFSMVWVDRFFFIPPLFVYCKKIRKWAHRALSCITVRQTIPMGYSGDNLITVNLSTDHLSVSHFTEQGLGTFKADRFYVQLSGWLPASQVWCL